MSCLRCQKQFDEHTIEDLVICIEWIQDQHHIRSEYVRKLFKMIGEGSIKDLFMEIKK